MIRIAYECALVFLLPALAYFGYVLLTEKTPSEGPPRTWAERIDAAPLVWLFALGVIGLFGVLATFATLEDDAIDRPYAPAIFKDGKIQPGSSN